MYIPSKELNYLIESEQFGVWSELYSDGDKVALIAKAASTTIKAVTQGCRIKLYIGVNEGVKNYYAIALKVFDSIENPILIPMTPRFQREAAGITGLSENLKFSFTMYNEVYMPSVCGEGILNMLDGRISKIIFPDNYVFAETIEEVNQVIDSFCFTIDPAYGTPNFHNFSVYCFDLELTKLRSMLVISSNEFGSINNQIDISDEGLSQEEQLAQFLENIHSDNVYHSPNVKIGKKERELIDILSFDGNCNYLIESKALCLNDSGHSISDDRKSSTLIKGAKKALSQLKGAAKAIRRGEKITTDDGTVINIIREQDIHGIVIVSDLLASEAWDDVISIIKQESEEGLYFHVIQFPEFINTIKLSLSPTVSFAQCLLQRYSAVVEHEVLNIKGIDSSLPMHYEE